MHDIYEGFLDAENEIPLLLDGKEFYFDAEETIKRLENQALMRDEQQSQAEQDFLNSLQDGGVTEIIAELSDEELQEELQLATEAQKEIKKEIAKRKKGDK